jgi:hypothetical protein
MWDPLRESKHSFFLPSSLALRLYHHKTSMGGGVVTLFRQQALSLLCPTNDVGSDNIGGWSLADGSDLRRK